MLHLGWVEDIDPVMDPEWEDKFDERLLWRGSSTAAQVSFTVRVVASSPLNVRVLSHEGTKGEVLQLPCIQHSRQTRKSASR